jgi:hypothetical protein
MNVITGGQPQNGTVQSLTATDHLAAKIATPAIGGDGEARLYARSIGGQERLAQIGGDAGAVPRLLASSEMCCYIAVIYPYTAGTTHQWGTSVSASGTLTTPAQTDTSLATEQKRWLLTTAASANAAALIRTDRVGYRGASAGRGGFTWASRAFAETYTATMRAFVGLYTPGSIPGTATLSALTNCCGFGFDEGDSNWSFVHNDGTGSATKVDLGANFPTNAGLYTFTITCEPGSSVLGYTAVRNDTQQTVAGSISTEMPDTGTFLGAQNWCSAGSGGTAAGLAGCFIYCEAPCPS